jgi:glucose-6-phosphate dehydrogenase assembly protein OpcA
MAPAMTSVGRRLRTLTWSGRQVSLSEVVDALARLNGKAAGHDADEAEHPHPRNCVLNLVAVVPETQSFQRVDRMAADLAENHHPLRVVCLRPHASPRGSKLDARVSSHVHVDGGLHGVQRDHVQLEVEGEAAGHLGALAEPLLISDVTTIVWWQGAPPLDVPDFAALAGLGNMLVVDSAGFDEPARIMSGLARLAERASFGIADMDWGRNGYWREQLAQVFEPAERRVFLDRLQDVQIAHAAGVAANPVPAALLAGWLSSRLRLGLEPRIQAVPLPGLQAGDLAALRLHAVAADRSLQVSITRKRGHLRLELRMDRSDAVTQIVPVPRLSDAELVVLQASHGRRDLAYAGSLREAARLLEGRG